MKALVTLAVLASTIATAAPVVDATLDDNRDLRVRVSGALVQDPWDPAAGASAPHADFVLRVSGTEWIRPSKITPFADSKDRVAIAFVLFGGEMWIGNDAFEKEQYAQYTGVLKELSPAFDRAMRKFAAPAGSTLTILTYAERVDVRLPETPLAALPQHALGTQQDYHKRIGNELVQAIERGLEELGKSTAPNKMLIVVTDGVDSRPDTARTRMRELAERGIERGVRMHAILYGSSLQEDTHINDIPGTLEPTQFVARRSVQIEMRLHAILAAMSQSVELTFPASAFTFDGRIVDLQLELGVLKMPFRYRLPDLRPRPAAVRRERSSMPLLIGCGAVGALALGVLALRRRRSAR